PSVDDALPVWIGPAYVSKVSRVGIRMGDLANPTLLREKVSSNIADINEALQHIYKRDPIEPEPIINDLLEAAEVLSPYVVNTAHILHEAVENGEERSEERRGGKNVELDGCEGTQQTHSPGDT